MSSSEKAVILAFSLLLFPPSKYYEVHRKQLEISSLLWQRRVEQKHISSAYHKKIFKPSNLAFLGMKHSNGANEFRVSYILFSIQKLFETICHLLFRTATYGKNYLSLSF